MKLDLSVHPEVNRELLTTLSFYRDNASPLIASEFLDIYDDAILDIHERPSSFPISLQHYRRKTIKRFPFSIFFEIRNSEVRILALAHQSRDPLYWLGRE